MNPTEPSLGKLREPYHAASVGPFQPHADPLLFYGGADRGEIVETMLRSVRDGDPVLHVHGERGSGRTMLSLVLASRLAERHRVLRQDRAPLTPATLLHSLMVELCPQHADLVPVDSEGEVLDAEALDVARRSLVAALEERSVDARPIVLLVDANADCDAETLALAESLAAVRAGRADPSCGPVPGLGAGTVTSPRAEPLGSPAPERRRRRPAVQIVLFHRIDARASRGIAASRGVNRPDNHYWLRRLSLAETGDYLHHHMLLFDYNRRHLFTREMAYFVADRSEGVFRGIDTIARNAFMIAGLENAEKPTMSHLLLAGLPPRERAPVRRSFLARHRGAVIALLGSSVVASALGVVLLATR